ncbi:MAG: tetratricopeptide repeat protein, partial [Sarcina sp.]
MDNRLINVYISKGEKAHDNGEFLKALNYYLLAEELLGEVDDLELYINIALLYDELSEEDTAIRYYKKAIKANNSEARAYYGLAVIYDEKMDYDRAIKFYKKAVDINPVYDKGLFFLANALDVNGEK